MRVEELDYELPPERIATEPVEPRDSARLLVVDRATGELAHRQVRDLSDLGVLRAGDLLVVNESRVLPAAFEGRRAGTGGRVRGLYLRTDEAGHWRVLLEAKGRLQPGERVELEGPGDSGEPGVPGVPRNPGERTALALIEPVGRGEWRVRCESGEAVEQVLHRVGHTPLPPYIQKARRLHRERVIRPEDAERYNTVYARQAGSVAAPTAGLHFTPDLLAKFEAQGVQRAAVTLHVGQGTFTPIRSGELAGHEMHEEWLSVPAATIEAIRDTRAAGGRILAVGTTTVRALESLPEGYPEAWFERDGDYITATRLFIYPDSGFRFRFTDLLMTNFHLPRSTLLAMVASLPGVGLDRLKAWYRTAVDEGYRFYSYGDAMLIV